MLARLAHVTARHRKAIIFTWIALTVFGGFAAGQVSERWLQSFSIPGYSAYEASQRTFERFGTGERPPSVVVFQTKGDATKSEAISAAMERALKTSPGARTSSFFSTGSDAYVSKDRHTTFMEVYPAGSPQFDTKSGAEAMLKAASAGLPAGTTVHVTGLDPIMEANESGETAGPSVLVEALIGGLGALIILFFVFGTLPAVLLPLAIAVSSILNTFTLVWILTYVTDVSIVVQFLIALVGLGVAIDYALLLIFRFRDELREGEDVETALVETMTHAGKAVIVSGSTVAIGLLSLVVLPVPFIRSIGIGGMLIPAVSVLAAITLLPALLAVLGERINSVRLLPKRLVDHGHPEDGPWGRWARFVNARPVPVAAVGLAITGVLVFYGLQLNAERGPAEERPRHGRRDRGPRRPRRGRDHAGRAEAARRARRERRRPGGRRRAAAPRGRHRRRRRAEGLARGRRGDRRGVPRRSTAPLRESRRSSIAPKLRWKGRARPSAGLRPSIATSSTPSTATSRTCSPSCWR